MRFAWIFLVIVFSCQGCPEPNRSGPVFTDWCSSWKSLVCSNDGVTHWNECVFRKQKEINPDLKFKNYGPCPLDIDSDCQEKCQNEPKNQFCTSNNMILDNQCHFSCLKEEYSLMHEDLRSCQSPSHSVYELIVADQDIISSVAADFLKQVLPQDGTGATLRKRQLPSSRYNSPNTAKLDTLSVNIEKGDAVLKVKGKLGWMNLITELYNENDFEVSPITPGVLKLHFRIPRLQMGYDKFQCGSCGKTISGKLKFESTNTSLTLIGQLTSISNCTKIKPIQLQLGGFRNIALEPTVKDLVQPHDGFFEQDINGLLYEKISEEVNKVLESTLAVRMSRTKCLSWVDTESDAKACFGMGQVSYCSASKSDTKKVMAEQRRDMVVDEPFQFGEAFNISERAVR